MKRAVVTVGIVFTVGLTLGFHGAGRVTAQQGLVKVTELVARDVAGSDGKQASIFLAELGPGAAVGKHYHPGDAFAYILEGSMVLEIPGKPPVTLKPGESGHVTPRQVHDDQNPSLTAPLKFLVFHIAKKGEPLAVPAQ
jgi:quercetin dioxygenase-like cupin family protein